MCFKVCNKILYYLYVMCTVHDRCAICAIKIIYSQADGWAGCYKNKSWESM